MLMCTVKQIAAAAAVLLHFITMEVLTYATTGALSILLIMYSAKVYVACSGTLNCSTSEHLSTLETML
eukprot:19942-Heterococcus_DN1.PRE.2